MSRGKGGIMKRPVLNEIPLSEVKCQASIIITMSPGQWDGLLASSYEAGFVLLELDENERPIRAYRRKDQ